MEEHMTLYVSCNIFLVTYQTLKRQRNPRLSCYHCSPLYTCTDQRLLFEPWRYEACCHLRLTADGEKEYWLHLWTT